jgi:small subunit ribosomal protein S6
LKRYETLFIVQSELSSEDITAIIDRYSKIITDMKGTILKVERWGKRKLAYLIRKQSRGFYILIDFAGKREIVAELERILKFDDKVLKYMSVKLADGITAEEIEKELAGSQKADLPPANIIPAGGFPAGSVPAGSVPAEPKTELPQEEKI